MRRVKRSKDAVVRALANLRTHGFLDWLRRWEATGDREGGPAVKQATNAPGQLAALGCERWRSFRDRAADQSFFERWQNLTSQRLTLRRIADTLNADGIASPGGASWHPGNVQRALALAKLCR